MLPPTSWRRASEAGAAASGAGAALGRGWRWCAAGGCDGMWNATEDANENIRREDAATSVRTTPDANTALKPNGGEHAKPRALAGDGRCLVLSSARCVTRLLFAALSGYPVPRSCAHARTHMAARLAPLSAAEISFAVAQTRRWAAGRTARQGSAPPQLVFYEIDLHECAGTAPHGTATATTRHRHHHRTAIPLPPHRTAAFLSSTAARLPCAVSPAAPCCNTYCRCVTYCGSTHYGRGASTQAKEAALRGDWAALPARRARVVAGEPAARLVLVGDVAVGPSDGGSPCLAERMRTQPCFAVEEYAAAERAVLAHPPFRAACAARGIAPEHVRVDPWCAGWYSADDDPARRLSVPMLFVQERPEDNLYPRP